MARRSGPKLRPPRDGYRGEPLAAEHETILRLGREKDILAVRPDYAETIYQAQKYVSVGRDPVERWEVFNTRTRLKLDPCTDLVKHSSELNWGYGGSGPAQLSLALLVDYLGLTEPALGVYQDFKFRVIAKLPQNVPWNLRRYDIEVALLASGRF